MLVIIYLTFLTLILKRLNSYRYNMIFKIEFSNSSPFEDKNRDFIFESFPTAQSVFAVLSHTESVLLLFAAISPTYRLCLHHS